MSVDTRVVSDAIREVARMITVPEAPGPDATGGHVECLTEAVMGITAGLLQIAEAVKELAAAVRRE